MEKEKIIDIRGESGNEYLFKVFPWDTALVCTDVVYVVMRKNKIGYNVIYVGSAGLFNGHIMNHTMLTEFIESGITHVGIHNERSEFNRYLKERDVIENFLPKLNKRVKK